MTRRVLLAALVVGAYAAVSSVAVAIGGGVREGEAHPQPPTRAAALSPSPTPYQRARRVVCTVFPASECANAMRVVRCESNYNPRAVGDHGSSVGYFQIHRPSWPRSGPTWRLMQPWHNTRYAYQIWRSNGWGMWTCARILGIA